jgi:hypothetical protein
VTIVFLKKSNISRIFPSAIKAAPRVGEEEVALAALSEPESFLASSSLIGGLTICCSLLGHRVWCKIGAASSRKGGEIKSEKRWDETCPVALSFIGVESDSVMIHFPRKDAFLF